MAQQFSQFEVSQNGRYYSTYGGNPTPASMPVAAMDCSGPDCQVVGSVPAETFAAPAGCASTGQVWTAACDGVDAGCVSACASDCYGGDAWAHFSTIYGGLLYLRPRNADVSYGVPIDGPIDSGPLTTPIQVGRVGVVDPDYDAGFEFGATLAVNAMTSIVANLVMLDTTTSNRLETDPPGVIRSLVSHPSSGSASADFLSAQADLDLQLDIVDVGMRHLFVGGQVFAVNYSVGARYARLEQSFAALFSNNGREQVRTNIDFDGGGFRLGLDAERYACGQPWRLYARSAASFVAGKFQANYFQGQSFDPDVVDTKWEAGRVVPILDLELGGGWCGPGGRLRLSAGYVFSAWFNTVVTQEYIRAVQQNDFLELGDTLTFDGLVARAELRF